jgi:hypothetical protein
MNFVVAQAKKNLAWLEQKKTPKNKGDHDLLDTLITENNFKCFEIKVSCYINY